MHGQGSLRPSFSTRYLSLWTIRSPLPTCVSDGKPRRRLLMDSGVSKAGLGFWGVFHVVLLRGFEVGLPLADFSYPLVEVTHVGIAGMHVRAHPGQRMRKGLREPDCKSVGFQCVHGAVLSLELMRGCVEGNVCMRLGVTGQSRTGISGITIRGSTVELRPHPSAREG